MKASLKKIRIWDIKKTKTAIGKSCHLFMQFQAATLHLVCLEWEKGKALKKHQAIYTSKSVPTSS
jgi:hypothetical protein